MSARSYSIASHESNAFDASIAARVGERVREQRALASVSSECWRAARARGRRWATRFAGRLPRMRVRAYARERARSRLRALAHASDRHASAHRRLPRRNDELHAKLYEHARSCELQTMRSFSFAHLAAYRFIFQTF